MLAGVWSDRATLLVRADIRIAWSFVASAACY